jgi:hypothetical protein
MVEATMEELVGAGGAALAEGAAAGLGADEAGAGAAAREEIDDERGSMEVESADVTDMADGGGGGWRGGWGGGRVGGVHNGGAGMIWHGVLHKMLFKVKTASYFARCSK